MQYNISYREKDNSWQYIISYKDNYGKWRQKSKQGFPKNKTGKQEAKEAAEEAIKELREELSREQNANIDYKDITFKEFVKIFLEHEKLYREENTVEITENALKKFEALNDLRLVDITNLNIQRCIDDMVKQNLKRRTIINYLSRIKVILNTAKDQYSIIKDTPTKKIKLPEEKETTEKKALTQSEFESLLSKIDIYKRWVVTLPAGSCGMRIGEIVGLKWCDINEERLEINVRQQYKRVNKRTEHGEGSLKSKNAYRTVPISPRVLTNLKKLKEDYPHNIDGRVFDYINTSSLATRLGTMYRKLGFDISVHELRHTYVVY